MLSYLVHFVHAFIPLSLVAGLLLALWRPVRGRVVLRTVVICIAAGALVGGGVYPVSLRQETLVAARTCLYGGAMLAALLHALAAVLYGGKAGKPGLLSWGGSLLFMALLAAVSVFSFQGHVAEQALSATTVLNTELILNLGGILLGAGLTALLVPLTDQLAAKNRPGRLVGVLLFASLLLAVQWSSELLLGLMRLELVELTSLRLSFVAKAGKYAYVFPYLQLVLIGLLAQAFYARRQVVVAEQFGSGEQAQRRKAQSRVMFEMRWLKAALASIAAILAVSLYYDLYASRPPKISRPLRIAPDAASLIKIGIEQVKDGKLHRYAMVTDDGHVVRFFLINRSMGASSKIAVVFDACMLCGDMGYLQVKNEVICIACNVRMFLPSIGKAGGCNPIPLPHGFEGDQVVITAAELDKGAKYFSEVIGIKVKDPVTGRELDSLKAPQRSEFGGRTYFFENEQSAEKFKAEPEKYVGKQQSRSYRVQGFRAS